MDMFLAKHKEFFSLFWKGLDFSISDFSLSVLLLPLGLFLIFYFLVKKGVEYGKMPQMAVEVIWVNVYAMFYAHLGQKGKRYIPFLFSMMMFIMVLNLGNLIPFLFPCTTQLAITMTLSFVMFLFLIFIGFYEHGRHFFGFFVPKGMPLALKPLLFVLEVFSFCIRPVSLALRLAVNMVAGHIMLHVIAYLGAKFAGIKLASIAILGILGIFEIGVALLQAYVFAILSCIYIADILHSH